VRNGGYYNYSDLCSMRDVRTYGLLFLLLSTGMTAISEKTLGFNHCLISPKLPHRNGRRGVPNFIKE